MNLRPSSGGEGGGPGNRPPSGVSPPREDPLGTACRQPSRLGLLSGMKIHLAGSKVVKGLEEGGATNLRPSSGGGPGNRLPSALLPPPPPPPGEDPRGTQPAVSSGMQRPSQPGLFQGLSFAGAMAVP